MDMSASPCPVPDFLAPGFPAAGFLAPEPGKPAPRALADLVAEGRVTHEMICDPGALGAEAPALNRLCALVGGEIYRIGPFHYAFRAEASDMEGALGLLPFDDWTGMIEAALRAELGAEAVWLYATDLLADALALEAAPQARAEAAPGAEAAPAEAGDGPEASPGAAALRLGALEARLAGIESGLGALLARVETLLARLDAGETRDDLLGEHLAEHLTLRLGATLGARHAERAGAEAAFEETIGLALAEFLARIERASAEPRARPC